MIVTCVPNIICLNFRKFYALLTIQLSISTGLIIIVTVSNIFSRPTYEYVDEHSYAKWGDVDYSQYVKINVLIGCLFGFSAILAFLGLVSEEMKKFPWNLLVIIGYSVLQGFTGAILRATYLVAIFFSFSLILFQQMRSNLVLHLPSGWIKLIATW